MPNKVIHLIRLSVRKMHMTLRDILCSSSKIASAHGITTITCRTVIALVVRSDRRRRKT